MPKPNMSQVQNAIQDPLLSINYAFWFPVLPTAVATTAVPHLLLQCKSATKPGSTINAVEIQLFGYTFEHRGNKSFNHDMSVSYMENSQLDITRIIEAWSEYACSAQTQAGAPKLGTTGYAKDGVFTIFNQQDKAVAQYIIHACWPSVVPDLSFNGESATALDVQATFKFDWYEPDPSFTPQA